MDGDFTALNFLYFRRRRSRGSERSREYKGIESLSRLPSPGRKKSKKSKKAEKKCKRASTPSPSPSPGKDSPQQLSSIVSYHCVNGSDSY